jgi:hypothetical protein
MDIAAGTLDSMYTELEPHTRTGDLVIRVLAMTGPGGGNPEVAFDAYTAEAARAVVDAYWN